MLIIPEADLRQSVYEIFCAAHAPAAVVTSIVGTIPTGTLVSCIGDLDVGDAVDRLRAAATAGTAELDLPTGRPITGPTDERLEDSRSSARARFQPPRRRATSRPSSAWNSRGPTSSCSSTWP
jgi:hypothetical protein